MAVVLLAVQWAGCQRKAAEGHEAPGESEPSMLAEATGQFRVTAGEHGFTPHSISIPRGTAGSKVTITFVRTTDKTCATEVVFPELDLKKDLPLNTPVAIDVPSDAARTLTFQCGMAMYKGAIVVK